MRIKHLTSSLALALVLLGSCSTPKNITYFQDVAQGSLIDPARQLDIKVKPEDKLSIIVSTQDPAVSALFNLVQSQNRLSSSSSVGSSSSSSSNGNTSLYTVNKFGDIKFPVLGDLHIAGMTRFEVANYIERQLILNDLVKDPIVTVEFGNTGISVIGEVTRPGRYEFNKDRLNIIDALAMAGDLTTNGERENVMVMRENEAGKQEIYKIDLTDLQAMSQSPAFYIQQNDVIYVEPNDKKKRETTANGNSAYTPSFWVSIGSFAVTIATLIISLTK